MPCPCLTPFALIMYFRFVWLLPWFGYVWIFTVQTKRHAALFALACPLALIQRKRALQFLWPTWSRRDVAQEHSCTRLVMKHRCCKAYRMNQNDRIIICEDLAVQLHRFDTQMLHGLRRVWHSQNQCPLAESGWKTSPVLWKNITSIWIIHINMKMNILRVDGHYLPFLYFIQVNWGIVKLPGISLIVCNISPIVRGLDSKKALYFFKRKTAFFWKLGGLKSWLVIPCFQGDRR